MQRFSLIISHIIFLLGAWASDTSTGLTFLFPNQAGETFYYLDIVNVTYLSPFESPLLYTFCNAGNYNPKVQDAAPFNGSTFVLLDFKSNTQCWFNLRPNASAEAAVDGINSLSFILSPLERNQTAVGLSANSSTPTSTASATAGTPTTSPTNDNPQGNGLTSGSKAALGVGVTLGVLGIAGAVASFFVVRRWRQKRQDQGMYYENMNKQSEGAFMPPTSSYQAPTYAHTAQAYEIAGFQQPQELAAGHKHELSG